MDTYHVVLYIHFVSLALAVGAASILIASSLQLRKATTLESAMPWGTLNGQAGQLFPISFLGLFGSGAYLTSDVWTWKTHWIGIGIAGLVVIGVQGGAVAGARGRALARALKANGPGPLGEPARRLLRDPVMWSALFANAFLLLAVVWVMTVKPATGGGIAALLIAEAVGILAARPLTRPSA